LVTLSKDTIASPPCEPQESVVDQIILENLNSSTYISHLKEQGFVLTRFRGPAERCGEIPNNYVHLNFEYISGNFTYSMTIQTYCDPLTLSCDFNPDAIFEQINYLESIDYISSRKECSYYKACEIDWFFGENYRVRYHCDPRHCGGYIDIFLVDDTIATATEYKINTPIDRCADGSLPCSGYFFGISYIQWMVIIIAMLICSTSFFLLVKRKMR
jgi:hypothetical protein